MKFIIAILCVLLLPNPLFPDYQQGINPYVFGKKLYADKMYELAAEQLHTFAIENPDDPRSADALYLAGLSYFNIKNYEQAQREFLFLILRFPDAKELSQAQFKIAECFQLMGKLSEAGNAYRQVQIYYPKSSLAEQALFLSAKMFFEAKQYDNAIEILLDYLEVYPTGNNYHNAKLLLAESFFYANNYDRALLELNKILSITETGNVNAKANLLKGNIFYQQGLFQQAESEYKELIKKYSIARYSQNQEISIILDEAYFKLGTIHKKYGLYENSNEFLARINNREANPEIQILLADNYISMNDPAKAILILQKIVIKQDLNRIPFYYQKLGDCYYSLNEFSKAIEIYKKVLEICKEKLLPEETETCHKAYLQIAQAYLNLHKPENAIVYLKEYRDSELDPKFKDYIEYQICLIYETKIKDFERAIRSYYDFIERYPDSKYIDDAQMGLARSYEKGGNSVLAVKEYQKLIDRYPASKHYKEAQHRIEYIKNYSQAGTPAIKNLGDILLKIIERDFDQHNNEKLLYKLALSYYHELKDYQTAIELFRKLGTTNKIAKDELLYLKGSAFQLLGQNELISQNDRNMYLDSAAFSYNLLLKDYSESLLADNAMLNNIRLQKIFYRNKPDSSIKIKEALTEFIKIKPNSKLLNEIYLELAASILDDRYGKLSKNDSLLVHACLEELITKFPNSNLVGEAIFLKSTLFYHTKNYDKAEKELSYFISNFAQKQKIAEAYFQYAKLSAERNDYTKAIDLMQNIITRYYYNDYADSAKLYIGKYLLSQKKYSDALRYFMDRYQELVPPNLTSNRDMLFEQQIVEDIIYNIGYCYKMLDNGVEAVNFFQEYLRLFPQGKFKDWTLFFLGELFDIRGEKDKQSKAIDYLKQLENNSSSNELVIKSIIKIADIYYSQENIEQAYSYYSKASKLGLNDEQKQLTSFYIINCLYKMGNINVGDEKYKEFKKSFKDEKNKQASLLLEKGIYFLNNKIFDQAEKIFKDARSEFKNTEEGLRAEFLLGKLYFILNKNEEALELLTTLIMRNPEVPIAAEIYITLGNFYYLSARQIENAMYAFKKASEQKSISEENLKIALHNLAKCYADLQQWEKAIAISREYIRRFPLSDDIVERKIQIAYYYFRLNEYDYAIQLFNQIIPEADIDNEPRIQFWIGECYFNKGDFQKAISEYLKILYISKPAKLLEQYKVTALYQAAISYIKLNKFDNAKLMLQRIINEQGAESVFGKSAREKLDEINARIMELNKEKI